MGSETILLAEDEEMVRNLAREIMRTPTFSCPLPLRLEPGPPTRFENHRRPRLTAMHC